MANKIRKIEKRLQKLNGKELRQINHVLNQIYIKDIKKRLAQLNEKRGE